MHFHEVNVTHWVMCIGHFPAQANLAVSSCDTALKSRCIAVCQRSQCCQIMWFTATCTPDQLIKEKSAQIQSNRISVLNMWTQCAWLSTPSAPFSTNIVCKCLYKRNFTDPCHITLSTCAYLSNMGAKENTNSLWAINPQQSGTSDVKCQCKNFEQRFHVWDWLILYSSVLICELDQVSPLHTQSHGWKYYIYIKKLIWFKYVKTS